MTLVKSRLSEAAFQRNVVQLARARGWIVAHFRASLNQRGQWQTAVSGDGAGYPDLTLVRERVVFAELKAEDGRVRPEQTVWLTTLAATGAETYVWRPRDWDAIDRVLTRRNATE
jgi:hypothetical protein